MGRGREIDWEDEDIVSGFKNDKHRQFRGKPGVTYVVRVVSMPKVYRVHAINDVLDPDKDGEERVFNMTCSKDWDPKGGDEGTGDWEGDCRGCDEEYDISDRYCAGILVVGEIRKEKVKRIDADDSPHYWDFGKDKYRSLSDIRLSLKRGKKNRPLKAVELEVSLNATKPEVFQDLNIQKRDDDHDVLTTKKHMVEWKDQGPELVDGAMAAPTKAEWKRRLKKKKPAKRARRGDSSDEKPTRSARSSKSKKDEPDDEVSATGDEELDDLLGELE